jgi:pyruvate dehydrogenase E1 component
LRSLVRWSAIAMVLRANRGDASLGWHIAGCQSAATL